MQYRPEVDGLRAVAILPVVFFHAGAGFIPGGFLGVDVFFVISGYLITSLLLEDLETGRYSVRTFYERRARRILPALFAVIVACLPFAWQWMLPSELKDFYASMFSTILFLANFFFLSQINYFTPTAELHPLLHTWSLSIEEQYYLLAPPILAWLWRRGRRYTFSFAILLTALSFAICIVAAQENAARNFFFSGSRFWEIGIGSICAIATHGRPVKAHPWISSLGLLAMFSCFALFKAEWATPGWTTLIPVVATAAVLVYGKENTPAGRLLSHRISVAIGLVSYSAYLIHQPLFAFARLRWVVEPPLQVMVALSALTFGLAYLSWRFVEQPFRRRVSVNATRRPVLPVAAGASTFLAAIALLGYLGKLPVDTDRTVVLQQMEERLVPNFGLSKNCSSVEAALANCTTGETPDTLVWGDSYAMHLVDGLGSDPDARLVQMTMSACTPVLGVSFTNAVYGLEWAGECLAFNQSVVYCAMSNQAIKTVVISSAFAILDKQGLLASGNLTDKPIDIDQVGDFMVRTVNALQNSGKKVVLVSPTPTAIYDVGNCLKRSRLYESDIEQCNFPLDRIENHILFGLMDRLQSNVPVIRLDKAICPDGTCKASQDQTFVFRDAGHLSHEGSTLIASEMGLYRLIKTIAR